MRIACRLWEAVMRRKEEWRGRSTSSERVGGRGEREGGMEVCVGEGWSRGVWVSWRGVRMGRVKRGVCTGATWRCARVWGSVEEWGGRSKQRK